jgi:hypothetical protein
VDALAVEGDEIDDEIDEALGEDIGEYIACAALLRSLVICQTGDDLRPLWSELLDTLDVSDVDWVSALVGMSKIDAEDIRPRVRTLLSDAVAWADRVQPGADTTILTQHYNAVLELLAGNSNMWQVVEDVFRELPADSQYTLQLITVAALEEWEVDFLSVSLTDSELEAYSVRLCALFGVEEGGSFAEE